MPLLLHRAGPRSRRNKALRRTSPFATLSPAFFWRTIPASGSMESSCALARHQATPEAMPTRSVFIWRTQPSQLEYTSRTQASEPKRLDTAHRRTRPRLGRQPFGQASPCPRRSLSARGPSSGRQRCHPCPQAPACLLQAPPDVRKVLRSFARKGSRGLHLRGIAHAAAKRAVHVCDERGRRVQRPRQWTISWASAMASSTVFINAPLPHHVEKNLVGTSGNLHS